ncbi:MAG: hypothetical protein JW727_06985 [Candidatus Aenigmarchaeota archaeon]|nr:hypothetical protein [Candidatus Aenigmarchaeota archaeon]
MKGEEVFLQWVKPRKLGVELVNETIELPVVPGYIELVKSGSRIVPDIYAVDSRSIPRGFWAVKIERVNGPRLGEYIELQLESDFNRGLIELNSIYKTLGEYATIINGKLIGHKDFTLEMLLSGKQIAGR